MCKEAPETILQRVRDAEPYISGQPRDKQAAHFECLIAQAFAHILDVPVFDSEHDDPNVHPRVTWRGKCSDMSCAPEGADAIARAHGFYVLIEPTLKTGYKQWSQEFFPCLGHYQSFLTEEQASEEDAYLAFVASELHEATYESIRRPPIVARFVLLELPEFASILDTSILTPYMKHAHLRKLLNGLLDDLQNSSSLQDFRCRKKGRMASWQKEILENERSIFLSIKSYQAVRQMGKLSAPDVDILSILQRDDEVRHYEELVGKNFGLQEIGPSLELHNLASEVTNHLYGHRLISVIPMPDVKARTKRILIALEERHG